MQVVAATKKRRVCRGRAIQSEDDDDDDKCDPAAISGVMTQNLATNGKDASADAPVPITRPRGRPPKQKAAGAAQE